MKLLISEINLTLVVPILLAWVIKIVQTNKVTNEGLSMTFQKYMKYR